MFYFEADKNWEVSDYILETLSGIEKYRFPCIQLTLNTYTFLLDVRISDSEGLTIGERLFFGSIEHLLVCLEQEAIVESKISLLSRRIDNDGDYVASDILEVIKAEDTDKRTAFIYCCKNKKRYVDILGGNDKSKLRNFKTIYKHELI